MRDRPKPSPTLTVETGVHAGAATMLAAGQTRLGPALECDIVLSDATGSSSAFTIDNADAGLVLTAGSAALEFERGRFLPARQQRQIASAVRFSAASLSFSLQPGADAPAGLLQSQRGSAWSSTAIIAGMLSALAVGAGLLSNAAPSVQATALPLELGPPLSPHSPAVPSLADRDALQRSFQRRLAAAALGGVHLAAQPDGSLQATGRIIPAQETTWRQAAQAFDADAGGRVVLVDQIDVAAEPVPLTVQAIWPGRNPYVIDGAGEKLFVGSVLPAGWTIHGITDHRVLLDRAGHTYSLLVVGDGLIAQIPALMVSLTAGVIVCA